MDEEVIELSSNTHVMTVLAQHSVLAQHLEGAVLTQHRLGEGGCLSSTSQGACAAPCEKKRHDRKTEGSNGPSKRSMKLPS